MPLATALDMSLAVSSAQPRESFFQPIDVAQTETVFEEYRRFLLDRDGEADFESYTLPKREQHMAELRAVPVRFNGRFDEELFQRQYRRYDRSVETDWITKLLLVLCKMNEAEEYAVDVMRASRKHYHESGGNMAFLEQVALTEEEYHTQLLLGCSQYFGIEVKEKAPVRPMLRFKIDLMAICPGAVFNSVVLASEGVILHTLHAVLCATGRILKDHPEVRDAVEERILHVMTDEIGHVTFNRYASGPLGVSVARKIYPFMKHAFQIGPEYRELCAYMKDDIVRAGEFELEHLPREVVNRGFFA